jgi:hypothetical protein
MPKKAPKKISRFCIVQADDWEGLFIDGKCVAQNHSFSPSEVLETFGIDCDYKFADQDWLGERGGFPNNLNDCKFD